MNLYLIVIKKKLYIEFIRQWNYEFLTFNQIVHFIFLMQSIWK